MCKSPRGSKFKDSNVRKYKIFVKFKRYKLRHLGDYAKLVQKEKITETQHHILQTFLDEYTIEVSRQLGTPLVLINHNTDVPLLHFKFVEA